MSGNGGSIQNATFTGNQAAAGSGYFAAAIGGGTALNITNTLFYENTTRDCGSPMACSAGNSYGQHDLQWPATHAVCANPDRACTSGTVFKNPDTRRAPRQRRSDTDDRTSPWKSRHRNRAKLSAQGSARGRTSSQRMHRGRRGGSVALRKWRAGSPAERVDCPCHSCYLRTHMRITTADPLILRLSARVGRALLTSRRSVVTAESCTGGWIAKALTDVAGSSQWFLEGFVTYSDESKVRRLKVPRTVLER